MFHCAVFVNNCMMQRAIFFENGQVYSLQQGMEGQTLESWLFISMHRLRLSTRPKRFFLCVSSRIFIRG